MDNLTETHLLEDESITAPNPAAIRQFVVIPMTWVFIAAVMTMFAFAIADSSPHGVKAAVLSNSLSSASVHNTPSFRENFFDKEDELAVIHGSQIDCSYEPIDHGYDELEICTLMVAGKLLEIKSPGRVGWQGCLAKFDGKRIGCNRMRVKDAIEAYDAGVALTGFAPELIIAGEFPEQRRWRTYFYFRGEQEILMWMGILGAAVSLFSVFALPLFFENKADEPQFDVQTARRVIRRSLICAFILLAWVSLYGFIPLDAYYANVRMAKAGMIDPFLREKIIGVSGLIVLVFLAGQWVFTRNLDQNQKAGFGRVLSLKTALSLALFMGYYAAMAMILLDFNFID